MQEYFENETACIKGHNIHLLESPEKILNSFDAEELIKNHTPNNEVEGYERITLYDDDQMEIVFCHWKQENQSLSHLHPGVDCWFKCLKGELTENRCRDGLVYKIKAGEVSNINDSHGPHKISNQSNSCTFTLHLYKKINNEI